MKGLSFSFHNLSLRSESYTVEIAGCSSIL